MVCGTQVGTMNFSNNGAVCLVQAMPAPGIWTVSACEGSPTNNTYWQTPTGVWNIGTMPLMPPKGQLNHPSEQPVKPLKAGQTAARAAKRQRGRERRKLGKALAAAQRLLGATQAEEAALVDELASSFEARAARLQGEVKVTVKRTFLEVDTEEEEEPEIEVPELPAPIFELSELAESWRRDYRKFRCGLGRGSKGEISDFASDLALYI